MMMLTPVTPSSYLTISQLENCALADHIPCNTRLAHLAFKNALPKPFRELWVLGGLSHPSPCTDLQ